MSKTARENRPVGGRCRMLTDRIRGWIQRLVEFLKGAELDHMRLGTGPLSANLSFRADEKAAWELHVELLTRIVTQRLPPGCGDEKAALDSVHALFPITREILRRYGSRAVKSRKIAISILNQVRPFTTKWHKESLSGAFDDERKRQEFRMELGALQEYARKRNRELAEIVKVEDPADLESEGGK